MQTTIVRRGRRGLAMVLVGLGVLLATAVAGSAAASPGRGGDQRAHVLTQDESGVLAHNGARLTRSDHALTVDWRVRTPEPGSYLYPTADQVPPGVPPHPEIVAGAPEVFTLWAFLFNFPERCTDMCDFDDIGEATAAAGGIYQLDGTIARHPQLELGGKIRIGMRPEVGAQLTNPEGAEIHVAMTSHGRAHTGADLERQLNGAVGGPPNWWVAVFHAD